MRPASPESGDLLERIADREPAALVRLHELLAERILDLAAAESGDTAAAPAITRAVFLEVWWLAAVTGPERGDARSWLSAIAARRGAEHRRTVHLPGGIAAAYDQHIARELAAVLAAGSR